MLVILIAIVLMSFIYPMFANYDFSDVSKINDFSSRYSGRMPNIGLVQMPMDIPSLMAFGMGLGIPFSFPLLLQSSTW